MKPIYKFCSPLISSLEEESGWECEDKVKRKSFSALRFHYAVYSIPQTNTRTYYGNPVDSMRHEKGVAVEVNYNNKYKLQTVDTRKTLYSIVLENTFSEAISSKISSEAQVGIKSALSKIYGEFFTSSQTGTKDTLSSSAEISRAITQEVEVGFSNRFTISPDAGVRSVHIVPTFKRVLFDVHITYIDFLMVNYERRFFGLRKKRNKYPAFPIEGRPQNIMKIMKPVASIKAWERYPSLSTIGDKEFDALSPNYRVKDEDPLYVEVSKPELTATPYTDFSERPSLYHIANTAFPLRWVKRKGEWTEEDLKNAELDEVINSVWSLRYGRKDRAK